jgi:hypothetical protein
MSGSKFLPLCELIQEIFSKMFRFLNCFGWEIFSPVVGTLEKKNARRLASEHQM